MKEVIIQGVAMIAASEVYKELERLTASRAFWRQAAAQNGREAAAYKAQLDAIRAAMYGAPPDGSLVSLAQAILDGYEATERMVAGGRRD